MCVSEREVVCLWKRERERARKKEREREGERERDGVNGVRR